ncbi:MAG: 30S ribosomal protein S20 [candidate division NC10 bacterium]|nr:30S ribosomal protein S20 [candidate division NC10 bacterium]
MPIIKSSEKDLRRTERRTRRNRAAKGKLRSGIKRVRSALAGGNVETAAAALAEATPVIDRAVSKGILHKNVAARHKSRLARRLNQARSSAAK